VLTQNSTLLLAGHDTTAATFTWWLYEMAQHPEWQARVRDEIREMRARVEERGEAEFSTTDMESMALMQATLKVRPSPRARFFPDETGVG
jgi:cytochrome P450